MKRSIINKMTWEDKFGRKYFCSLNNHRGGLAKMKKENRRELRRKLKNFKEEGI